MVVKIYHRMKCYTDDINDIRCCDCCFDKVYFLLRQKIDYENLVEIIIEDDFFINCFDGTVIVVCINILDFLRNKRFDLSKKTCINDVIHCLKNRIPLCSICTIELFRKSDVLHKFELKW